MEAKWDSQIIIFNLKQLSNMSGVKGKTGVYLRSQEHRDQIRSRTISENNPNWKGDKVGYWGLHKWVYYHKGKAKKCENCGTSEGKIEWANKSRMYLRDLDDWISLCRSCHIKYDNRSQTIWDNRRANL